MNRPLFAVYRKVIRMYDARNYVGRYTKDEERLVLQLYRRIGANWIDIGAAMGRSPASVKDKVRMLKHETNKGFILFFGQRFLFLFLNFERFNRRFKGCTLLYLFTLKLKVLIKVFLLNYHICTLNYQELYFAEICLQ